MELICPSCEARYRVPDSAIGGRGRQVSCSNCGHAWHAAPPLVLGDAARTGEPAMAGSPAPVARAEPGPAGSAEVHSLRPGEPSRIAQLAEIRDMIAQVQSDERAPGPRGETRHAADAHPPHVGPAPSVPAPTAAPTAAPAASAAPVAPAAARPRSDLRRVDDVDDPGEPLHQDPLRRRMAEHDARAARERDEREKLRRSMKHRKEEPKPGSGAFLSGFLLVVLVAAALLGTYVMHEEVALRVPESAPMLAEYVDAMDDLRVTIAEGYEQARAWVMDLVADFA